MLHTSLAQAHLSNVLIETSLHVVGHGDHSDPRLKSQGRTEITSPCPFKTLMAKQDLQRPFFGDTESTISPDCRHSD